MRKRRKQNREDVIDQSTASSKAPPTSASANKTVTRKSSKKVVKKKVGEKTATPQPKVAQASSKPKAPKTATATKEPLKQTTSTDTAPEAEAPKEKPIVSEQVTKAKAIIKKYSFYGAMAGIVPTPVLGMSAVAGVSLKMLSELCELYDRPFNTQAVKSIVATIAGAIINQKLSIEVVKRLAALLPVKGRALGLLGYPITASGITYLIGLLFLRHLEKGGCATDLPADSLQKA